MRIESKDKSVCSKNIAVSSVVNVVDIVNFVEVVSVVVNVVVNIVVDVDNVVMIVKGC